MSTPCFVAIPWHTSWHTSVASSWPYLWSWGKGDTWSEVRTWTDRESNIILIPFSGTIFNTVTMEIYWFSGFVINRRPLHLHQPYTTRMAESTTAKGRSFSVAFLNLHSYDRLHWRSDPVKRFRTLQDRIRAESRNYWRCGGWGSEKPGKISGGGG